MSWLYCSDCGNLFDAKNGEDWRDKDGHITCFGCLEDEEADTDWERDSDCVYKEQNV